VIFGHTVPGDTAIDRKSELQHNISESNRRLHSERESVADVGNDLVGGERQSIAFPNGDRMVNSQDGRNEGEEESFEEHVLAGRLDG
jgi:hypothetical protein